MMTLGIPGDPVTAILIGALIVHGLAPGPLMFLERADFAYGVIFSFFWANITLKRSPISLGSINLFNL